MYLRHGQSQTPEYKCWQQIKARCLNENHRAYPDYGGRGVTMAPEWVSDFAAFLEHVGVRPSPRHSLDRWPNNDGNYEPGNVRWATPAEQNNNRRPHRAHGERALRPTRTDGMPTNFKHGLVDTPEYKAWSAMKTRCLNESNPNYPRWGGRGITIYQPWVDDFMAFYSYIGPKPGPTYSLDRYPNNDGGYEPGNVRWASKRQQSENRGEFVHGSDHGNFDHGGAGTPEYKTWTSIKTRCFNEHHDKFKGYGALGITMCQGWRDNFAAFNTALGPKPSPQHTAYRPDPAGSYTCGSCEECVAHGRVLNCRWGTATERNRNRRPTERSGKLTVEKVATIRQRQADGATEVEIAAEFGIGRSLAGKIKRREVWA
jgi:hypothetical protein